MRVTKRLFHAYRVATRLADITGLYLELMASALAAPEYRPAQDVRRIGQLI
ncbi:hypothetical protein [Streptomyces carpinensis]|uniref:Uncharacterized protein n=1 Tax=Streptomyces carpinensis TaxID=66369 RepID=A0ABV1VXW7_9ACTN|nr:hypothetical protein [Streptomyces carpinensis]